MDKNKILKFIDLAVRESRKGFYTYANPKVGCVIEKNGKIISTGYHKIFGGPHAEIEAISNCRSKKKLEGSNMYVTLEPCSHWGKTPPCTGRIIKEKIKNVFIGMKDVNPVVAGKGIKKLKENGMKVFTGFREELIREINQPYLKFMKYEFPYIAVKYAMTLDGKIALKNGASKYITGEKARLHSKTLRDQFDAIMVGTNTIIRDNPVLNGLKKRPVKILLDRNLKISLKSKIFFNSDRIFLFTSVKNRNKKGLAGYRSRCEGIFFVKEDKGKLNIFEILKALACEGIPSVFIEGGANLTGDLFDRDLVDLVYVYISGKILGGKNDLGPVEGRGIKKLIKAKKVEIKEIKKLGNDLFIKGIINKY